MRQKNLVRVIKNPDYAAWFGSGARANGAAAKARGAETVQLLEARRGTPPTVAEIGGLRALILDSESVKRKPLRLLKVRLSDDEYGDKEWKFNSKQTGLASFVADGHGDLHIVGYYKPLPEGLQAARSHFISEVVGVVYSRNGEDYQHDFAEHGGEYPRLYYKDGFLFFRGGTYDVTAQGEING